ncbi:MAG TPA: tripartite tricarboxylate transporter substrate binding protein [Burkholderiaceae bacterium]|nr:tripartite tricarboxylate transporter substrate binding protein [Burkholderiaceae bacterium]
MPSRRRLLASLFTAAVAWSGSHAALAADKFPSKPIRIVVPFGAGGVADLTARTVAQAMAEQLKQGVIIENKPGAGGIVASETVARATPDGYTLLLMSNGTAVSEGLFKKLPFDSRTDFAPISLLGMFDMAVLVPGNSPYKTLPDLLAKAKTAPINIGTVAIGSTQNLAAELLKNGAGVDAQIVPFNGTPAVVTALRGGQIDAAVEILAPMVGQIQSGAVRALAVMGDKRNAQLASVPTVKESAKLTNVTAASWNALAAPAKTPKPVIDKLQAEVARALAKPDVKKRLAELGVEARASTPAELSKHLDAEIKRWGAVIDQAKIEKQ